MAETAEDQMRIGPDDRLALLMHDHVRSRHGKAGFALLRYRASQVVAVIDRADAGGSVAQLTGIDHGAPIVFSVRDALALGANVLVVAVATTGGALPDSFRPDLRDGLRGGMSVVYPLHGRLSADPELAPLVQPGRWIWDVRVEPEGLMPASLRALDVPARRVLTVGTDMAIGKMTAALELDRAARARGLRSKMLASGQIGMMLTGDGLPVDAVRVDFATGVGERLVLDNGFDNDVLYVEGQGSVLNPASSAWLALLRGACPTHLVLVARAGQTHLDRFDRVAIPPLLDVAHLYEQVAHPVCPAKVVGIALNCAQLDDAAAHRAVGEVRDETGLPTADVLRHDLTDLLDATLKAW